MLIKIEGFNEAIQGYTVRHGEKVYVYDYDQMIEMTARDNSMSREAARLYLEKNVLDVFASDGAPVFRFKL